MQSINIHTDNGIEWIQWASENEIDDELLKWLEEAYMFSCRK